jgi:hypothetical protein
MIPAETTAMFKRGDRVRHTSRTDWGLGEVLNDQSGDRVRGIFEDVGVKTFDLKLANFTRVRGDEATSEYLTMLVKQATKQTKKGAHQRVGAHTPFPVAINTFLHEFPGGFQDPDYLAGPRSERAYKVEAHEVLRDILGPEILLTLVHDGDYAEVWDRAKRVINRTNLIHHYEKIWLTNSVSSPGRQSLFGTQLAQYLYGDGPWESRFGSFVRMLYDIGAGKWPIATYFWFIGYPDSQMFVKPEVTKRAALMLSVDIDYRPEVNWNTYERVVNLAGVLKDKLIGLGRDELVPRDMIDIQSFMWVVGPAYMA